MKHLRYHAWITRCLAGPSVCIRGWKMWVCLNEGTIPLPQKNNNSGWTSTLVVIPVSLFYCIRTWWFPVSGLVQPTSLSSFSMIDRGNVQFLSCKTHSSMWKTRHECRSFTSSNHVFFHAFPMETMVLSWFFHIFSYVFPGAEAVDPGAAQLSPRLHSLRSSRPCTRAGVTPATFLEFSLELGTS